MEKERKEGRIKRTGRRKKKEKNVAELLFILKKTCHFLQDSP